MFSKHKKLSGKKAGLGDFLTLLGVMFILVLAFIVTMLLLNGYEENKRTDLKNSFDVQDEERSLNSLLSLEIEGGRIHDLLMRAYYEDDYAELESELSILISAIYGENKCFMLFVNGEEEIDSGLLCDYTMESQMVYPAHDDNLLVELRLG